MANGKVTIEAQLETKKFDKQIDALEEKSLKLEKELKEPQKYNLDTRQAQANLEKIRNQITDLNNKSFKQGLSKITNIEFNPTSIKKLNNAKVQFEGINNSAIKLQGNLGYVAKNINDLGFKQKEATEKTSKGFNKNISSLKRFGLSLLSVGSIFAVVSKASSSYLQHDEELAKKMSDTWAGLGAILYPIINGIANILLKGVAIINQFIYALTGVNLVAKANEKALKKQTSAQKALNKETAKFDEITTLGTLDKASSTGSSIENQIELPTLSEKTIDTINKIAKALKPVYNVIKDIIKWCLDHPDIILTMLGVGALVTGLGKVIGLSTGTKGAAALGGTGLAGLLGILLAIASIGVITISIVKVVEEINKLNESTEGAKNSIKSGIKLTNKYISQSNEVIKGKKKEDQITKDTAKSYANLSNSMLAYASSAENGYRDIYKEQQKYGIVGNLLYAESFERQKEAMNLNIEDSYKYLTQLDKMYDANQLGKEGIDDYASSIYNFMYYVGKGGISIDNLTKRFGLNKDQAQALQQMYYKVRLNLEKIPETKKIEVLVNLGIGDTSTFSGQLKTAIDNGMVKALTNVKTTFDKMKSMFTGNSWVDKIMRTTLGKVKLAQGGIVNNPGKGVPIGTNIIAGEAGREAVLPLNDQVLSQLGQQIGKYITINATMVNNMNGRQISRELQRIQSNNDFTSNR